LVLGDGEREAESQNMIRVIALASLPLRMPSVVVDRATGFFASAGDFWRTRMARLTDGYHPERHYMRGPGPKWREKHPEAEINSQ
jgi:hypothetical protein